MDWYEIDIEKYQIALVALHQNIKQLQEKETHWHQPASREQVGKIIILMRELMLEKNDRDRRIDAVRNMTGLMVNSTNDLLKWEAHCLIEFLEDKTYGRDLVIGAELNL